MIVIIYTIRDFKGFLDDGWWTCETMQEAEKHYAELLKSHYLHSASICSVVKSTDYSPTKELT
jgi:hypothetical protein